MSNTDGKKDIPSLAEMLKRRFPNGIDLSDGKTYPSLEAATARVKAAMKARREKEEKEKGH